jgi:CheY-like chemotaxis protein
MAAGMNDFLTKPIDAERLRQTLRQVLMEAEASRGLAPAR